MTSQNVRIKQCSEENFNNYIASVLLCAFSRKINVNCSRVVFQSLTMSRMIYYYYYCKFIVIRRTQASKPRPLIQKDIQQRDKNKPKLYIKNEKKN